MYCPACGTAITQPTKYCRQCGGPLTAQDEAAEKRFDAYLTDIFSVSVVGFGYIVGGTALLGWLLHLSRGIVIGYLVLSSAVFLIQFGLHLWEILRMRGLLSKQNVTPPIEFDTNKLKPAREQAALEKGGSVIESTTRTLKAEKEPVGI